MNAKSMIKGTLILTITGLITRIMGFYYRIFLSNKIGAENLGLYQMIFPLLMLAHSLTSAGIQLVISRLVAVDAAHTSRKNMRCLSGLRYHLFYQYLYFLSFTHKRISSPSTSFRRNAVRRCCASWRFPFRYPRSTLVLLDIITVSKNASARIFQFYRTICPHFLPYGFYATPPLSRAGNHRLRRGLRTCSRRSRLHIALSDCTVL